MQTDLFIKKWWMPVLSCLLSGFVFSAVIYAAFLTRSQTVWLGKSFYFLLSDAEHVEAGAYSAQLNGGAGYLLEYDGREYVALSVYLSAEQGVAVQNALSTSLPLLQIDAQRLYFKSCKEKKNAALYQGALDCLYGCMEVLGLEIDRLAAGATQQSSWRTLGLLLKQLRYLASVYEKDFRACAQVYKNASERLGAILSDVIYVKDLRYLLCDLTASYLRICANFSL